MCLRHPVNGGILPYFLLRWSEDWSVASVRRFNQKWGVAAVQHVSDEGSSYEEGTVVGFASAWRSRVVGLHVREHDIADLDVLGQGLLMTAMLASVDREYFSIGSKDDSGLPFTLAGSLIATSVEARVGMCSGLVPDGKLCDNKLIERLHSGEIY